MWKCPVCDQENNAATVCPTCGYDRTCDYERYPTAFTVTTAKPTRTLRRQWQAKQNPPTNPQPQPAAPPTAQPTSTAAPAKKESGLWKALAVVAVIAFVIAAVKFAVGSYPSVMYYGGYSGAYVNIRLNSGSISNQMVEDAQKLLKAYSCTRIQISEGAVDAASMEQISKLADVEEIVFSGYTKVSDFDRLSGMPNLSCIHLTGSSESESELDLTGIESIATLESLYISGFESVDLTELRNAVQLKSLGVNYSDNITNLNGLAGLTNLTQLDLISDRISDLQPLSDLTNLTELDLGNNQISDLQPISNLTNLTVLGIRNNQITSLAGLENLTKLTSIDAYGNNITTLAGLENLTNLTELSLYGNQISDLQSISKLSNLTYLSLESNRITSLTGLENLTNLTFLVLDNNQISDLQPISGLTNLKRLNINGNQITSLAGLENLTKLTDLEIGSNQITTLAGLENLTNLTDIYASGNPLTDTSALEVSGCMGALQTDSKYYNN